MRPFHFIAQAFRLSAFYFVLVFTCGALFGSVRASFSKPALGALYYAELLELPLMLFIIWQSARVTIDRLKPEEEDRPGYLSSILIGGLALGWLVGVELATKTVLQGHIYFIGLDASAGSRYGLAVLFYTIMPWCIWRSDRRPEKWQIEFDGSVEEEGTWF
ncbi:hypothetical protein EDD36DRAFT_464273 [Exophiala viscosa]|uniref:Uncharacterized protein n=1 Tax=Exophiala viscosa TaxID=2486360 RepID=A0AAN6IGE4_9EURO|nr:hypothetical protein EDD36DRAFT_464273 [Exophiala viscosa]